MDDNKMCEIGKVIRLSREKKGLTQAELAKSTGLSRSYISDLENERYMPSVTSLAKLATALGFDLNFLSHSDVNTSAQKET